MLPMDHVIGLSAILFTIGVLGVATRRNIIVMLMSIELMLNAVNLAFVGFNRIWSRVDGAPAIDGQFSFGWSLRWQLPKWRSDWESCSPCSATVIR